MNLADQTSLLATLTCSLPFRGKSGSSKKNGCCPHCGADPRTYRYPPGSRWKHCYRCGYDRLQQKGFEGTRWIVKQGRPADPAWIQKAIDYYQKVYK